MKFFLELFQIGFWLFLGILFLGFGILGPFFLAATVSPWFLLGYGVIFPLVVPLGCVIIVKNFQEFWEKLMEDEE